MTPYGDGTVGFDRSKGCWYARVPVGTDNRGRTKYRKRLAATKREAQQLQRELLSEIKNGVFNQNNLTFRAFAELHLDGEARQEIREVTRRGYIYLMEKYAYPRFGNVQIGSIRSPELVQFLIQLRKNLSASQVNHLRAAMSRVFQSAVNHQLIEQNPVRRTKRMRAKEGDKTNCKMPWTLDECKKAMSVAVGTEMDLFIHLAILTGARMGEMMGLKWSDIDFNAKTLRIQRTLVELRGSRSADGVKGSPSFSPPKTAKSVRTLSFGQQLDDALHRHKIVQDSLRNASGGNWVESGCVFTTVNGAPVWVSNFSARYRKFLKEKGLRHVNVHSMRHGAAQNAIALGVPLFAVSAMLGHSSIAITNDIYMREATDLANSATEGLTKWFGDNQ
jgi:integrase